VAALVSISNADIETVSLSNNPKFLNLIERSRARQKSEGGISSEEMLCRLEKPKRLRYVR
jgi:predicted phage gp36 major capsid-like protein